MRAFQQWSQCGYNTVRSKISKRLKAAILIHLFNARRVMPAAQILPKVNMLFHMVCDCDDSEK